MCKARRRYRPGTRDCSHYMGQHHEPVNPGLGVMWERGVIVELTLVMSNVGGSPDLCQAFAKKCG